jgi:NADH dehydrogenase
MKKILILGGGFGGIYTTKYLLKYFKNNLNIEIILVNENNYFLFTPLLTEVATGGVSLRNVTEPIREVFNKFKNFKFIHSQVLEINLNQNEVILECGRVNYDYLIIALGSKTNFYNISGAEKYSFTLKTISDAMRLKKHFINLFEKASFQTNQIDEFLRFVIVGGGPTGVELALEMKDLFCNTFSKLYSKELIDKIEIIIIEKNNDLVSNFNPKLRQKILNYILTKNIKVIFNQAVKEINENYLILENGSKINTNTVIWTAGIKPNLPKILGNIEYEKERIKVNEFLQVKNYKNVFAIGDCAYIIDKNGVVPQLAQSAVAEAQNTSLNIYNLINNKNLKQFEFQPSGYLISLGRFNATLQIKNFIISGFWIWILWKMVYLSKMISIQNKIKTFIDWLVDLFFPRNSSEI